MLGRVFFVVVVVVECVFTSQEDRAHYGAFFCASTISGLIMSFTYE